MEFVGEHLKKSRLKKKLDQKTVAQELNIQLDLFKRIENNDFNDNLDLVYLIGHIRSYAKLLGLNENDVVKQFKDQNLIDKEDLTEELPKPLLERSNFYFAAKTFSAFSIILISFGFYFLFIKENDMNPNYSIIPDLSESLESEIEEIEIQSALKNINKINSESKKEILTTTLRNLSSNENLSVNAGSAIASIPNNKVVESDNIITLKFFSPTWIQLRNKEDQIVFSKLMSKDEEYSYSVDDNFTLTTGNAGNILVLINSNVRGKVGKKGEIIDSLVISSDFNN